MSASSRLAYVKHHRLTSRTTIVTTNTSSDLDTTKCISRCGYRLRVGCSSLCCLHRKYSASTDPFGCDLAWLLGKLAPGHGCSGRPLLRLIMYRLFIRCLIIHRLSMLRLVVSRPHRSRRRNNLRSQAMHHLLMHCLQRSAGRWCTEFVLLYGVVVHFLMNTRRTVRCGVVWCGSSWVSIGPRLIVGGMASWV